MGTEAGWEYCEVCFRGKGAANCRESRGVICVPNVVDRLGLLQNCLIPLVYQRKRRSTKRFFEGLGTDAKFS